MYRSDIEDLSKGYLGRRNYYSVSEWLPGLWTISDLMNSPSTNYKTATDLNFYDREVAIARVNEAIKNATAAVLLATRVISICDNATKIRNKLRYMPNSDSLKIEYLKDVEEYAEILRDLFSNHDLVELRRGLTSLVKMKQVLKTATEIGPNISANNKSKSEYYIHIHDAKTYNDFKALCEAYIASLNVWVEKCGLSGYTLGGSNILSSFIPQSFTKRLGLESYLEGDVKMSEKELSGAQEGMSIIMGSSVDLDTVTFAIGCGAAMLPLMLLSPAIARSESGEPVFFSVKDFGKNLKGLRSVFGSYMNQTVGFTNLNVDKKIQKAIEAFKTNKTPIYMNEVMWDKVKDFHKKYEWVFDNIKALIADYKENIGPKSENKFEFEKNEKAFELANEWLEKYLGILDDMNDMTRWVLKDVNGLKAVPVAKVHNGPDAGTTYFVDEDTKTGRRISPDIVVSEKDFFNICNPELCADFKKTFKAKKVLGKIKTRKGAANESMKENFESAIRDLCRAYMYYICYIYIMCSEAYHKKITVGSED